MSRKIIQIAVSSAEHLDILYALASDGTLWLRVTAGSDHPEEETWSRIQDLPKEEKPAKR